MANRDLPSKQVPLPPVPVKVWDLPTRLFHWLLVLLVAGSFFTIHWGGNAMLWHDRCGFAIMALIIFRLIWGVIGSRSARFTSFLRGPGAVKAYAKTLFSSTSSDYIGHNPLGGWSIAAMLATLLFQASSGLFSNDGIILQGPLAHRVANATSSLLTDLHRINQLIIALLIGVHLGAIFFYWKVKKNNLVLPMLTGIKSWHEAAQPEPQTGPAWPALIATAVSVATVYLLVR